MGNVDTFYDLCVFLSFGGRDIINYDMSRHDYNSTSTVSNSDVSNASACRPPPNARSPNDLIRISYNHSLSLSLSLNCICSRSVQRANNISKKKRKEETIEFLHNCNYHCNGNSSFNCLVIYANSNKK